MKDLVKTITHENQRSMDIQDHRDINKNRDDDTKYASNFSDFATRYFSHALWLNDKGFSKTPLTTAVTTSMINNNREFAKLDKNLGANRQLHHKEINLAKQKTSEYANLKGISQDEALKLLLMAGASMTDMLWNNSFDANSQDLAQAKEYLSQFKDQTYIDKEGKVQNYFVAKENDYTKPYINLYEAAFSGVSNVSDYLKSGITQSPYQGIMDKIKNATDHALNNKADTAKAVGSEIKNSLSDCANSPLKCGSNILQSIGNGIIDGTYGLAYNTMPSLANDLNSFYGFTASDYLTALSAANILGSGLEATGAVGLGKLAKDGVVAVGKVGAKGVNLVKNTNFTDAALSSIVKLDQLITIKGVQTINIGGKEYAVVGHNPLTKNYIIRPTGVIKKEKVLVGNHYEVTQDGLLPVGKNALQRSGIKTISKQEFKKASDLSMINYARWGRRFYYKLCPDRDTRSYLGWHWWLDCF